MTMSAVLAAEHIICHREGRVVLDDVSFSLSTGSMTALLGPNGAGKTTLLRALLGLERFEGQVMLNGEALSALSRRELARRVAYVPQTHAVAFAYSVRDMVAMGRLPYSRFGLLSSQSDEQAVSGALERLNILHLAERAYTQLSGGEQQAVLIARALAQGGRMLVMDEPASALDFGQQQRLWAQLRALATQGYTILCTTHDPLRAREIFDDALLLQRGRLVGNGPVATMLTDERIDALYGLSSAR